MWREEWKESEGWGEGGVDGERGVGGGRSSLVPRPSMPPAFDRFQYAKMEGTAWGIFSRDTRHNRHTSLRLISTVKDMYETDLAFCASYKDGTSAN